MRVYAGRAVSEDEARERASAILNEQGGVQKRSKSSTGEGRRTPSFTTWTSTPANCIVGPDAIPPRPAPAGASPRAHARHPRLVRGHEGEDGGAKQAEVLRRVLEELGKRLGR